MTNKKRKPHQNPSPMKRAIKTGARAVPTPNNALSLKMVASTFLGYSKAAIVFIVGTVRPKPKPKNPVATSKVPIG